MAPLLEPEFLLAVPNAVPPILFPHLDHVSASREDLYAILLTQFTFVF